MTPQWARSCAFPDAQPRDNGLFRHASDRNELTRVFCTWNLVSEIVGHSDGLSGSQKYYFQCLVLWCADVVYWAYEASSQKSAPSKPVVISSHYNKFYVCGDLI